LVITFIECGAGVVFVAGGAAWNGLGVAAAMARSLVQVLGDMMGESVFILALVVWERVFAN
jgi:hypothetical protein